LPDSGPNGDAPAAPFAKRAGHNGQGGRFHGDLLRDPEKRPGSSAKIAQKQ
jgi:hypothetical protein